MNKHKLLTIAYQLQELAQEMSDDDTPRVRIRRIRKPIVKDARLLLPAENLPESKKVIETIEMLLAKDKFPVQTQHIIMYMGGKKADLNNSNTGLVGHILRSSGFEYVTARRGTVTNKTWRRVTEGNLI